MDIKKYYGATGDYLVEHADYFTEEQLQKDVDFLKKALDLSKDDTILDLACGSGRHTIELGKQGFSVEGVDFSGHLLKIARQSAKDNGIDLPFHRKNLHTMRFTKKFDKIFLFFSEFGLMNAQKVLKSVSKALKPGGLFLLDFDNLFRVVQYLAKHPESEYRFDSKTLQLYEKGDATGVQYYTFLDLARLFKKYKIDIVASYGNYDMDEFGIMSKRVILVGKNCRE